MTASIVLLAERPRVEERQLLAAFAARGHEARLLAPERLRLSLTEANGGLPLLALDRGVATAERVALAALLTAGGTTVVNRAATTRLLADRLALLRHLIVAGIAVPETSVSFGEPATLAAIQQIGFPALLLAPLVDPSLPNAVVEDRDSAEALVEQRTILGGERMALVQRYLPTPGYKTRLVIAGERVIAIEKRHHGEGDDLGELYADPPPALLALGVQLIGRIGSGAYVVDLIETPAGPVVIGAENLLDFRSLAAAGVDVAGALADWALANLTPPAPPLPRGEGGGRENEILCGLVAIPSVSGNEAAAVNWLCGQMTALGYEARVDPAGNAVGTRGAGEREIVLLGHIDTVPGDIPVRVEAGVLHGRGAVDAKGPLATFVVAGARAALPAGVRLTVIGAVGEESIGSPGATWLATHHPAPAACIIGEPSGWDGVVLGYKGSLAVVATVTRAMSHSAGPDETAPELLLAFWRRITAWVALHNGPADAGFEALDFTLRGLASSTDGLYEQATLEGAFRLPPAVTSDSVRTEVDALAEQSGVTLDWRLNAEAYRTDKRSPLVAPFLAAIRAAGGSPRLKVKTGTSDMNLVGPAWNCPVVAYGPGDARFDHTPDEQIALADVERAEAVLTAALERIASWSAATGN